MSDMPAKQDQKPSEDPTTLRRQPPPANAERRTCPVHGWTLIQKFRSERTGPSSERVYPIDEWWCRSCGYDAPVPTVAEAPPARSTPPEDQDKC